MSIQKLRCPRCGHEQIGRLGVPFVCKSCRYGVAASGSVQPPAPGPAPAPAPPSIGVFFQRLGLVPTAIICTAVVLGGSLFLGLVNTDSPSANRSSPSPPTRAVSWQTIAQWNGNGMKETERFSVSASEWRIAWASANERIAGILQVFVYNEAGELITLAANQQGTGSDVSYVHTPPGRFYLSINSANVDWAIAVQAPL